MLSCMPRRAFIILLWAMLIVSIIPVLAELNLTNSTQNSPISQLAIDNESVQVSMLKLPLSFIENLGQSSNDVKFMIKTSGKTIFFTPSDIVFALSGGNNSSVVHMEFEGSKSCQIIGEGQLPGTANFFIGNDSSKWVTEIPTYSAVRYKDFYPGVDLVFKGTEGSLKHELLLKPGADPAKIVMAYSGQDNLSLDKNGSILIKTIAGNLTDSAPFCYQDIDGSRVIVEGKYRRIDTNKIGFEIKEYNQSLPLVIDPLLRYSTYLGGKGYDEGNGIAVDCSGNAYVTGRTKSTDFPTKNAYQAANAGFEDAFVIKLSPAGNKLVYSTYLGGSGPDSGNGIAIDSRGNAYVTGRTDSTDFPTKNAYQAANAGFADAFVIKLSPAGNKLVYSTYLGGSRNDFANGIAIGPGSSGNAYVTGRTKSTDFPTQNPYQVANAGNNDTFVTKLSPAGNRLIYSTYMGGSKNESGSGVAVDRIGNAYVTGFTDSDNFPTKNPYQATKAKCSDAFITKLNPAGNKLVYSTYLGGNSCDIGYGIAVDSSGDVYIAGITPSTDFPTKNPYQAVNAGGGDVFAAKLNPAGNKLVYSTYLGGSGEDWGKGISVDSRGNAYVTGWTYSTNFPTKNAYQAANAGVHDAFIAVFTKAPPNTPSMPSGPVSGKIRTLYRYTTSAIDPEGGQIKYTFNWGDGTTSTTRLVDSGTEAFAYHRWTKEGTFQVKAMATDSKGATSEYSSALGVRIGYVRLCVRLLKEASHSII